MIINNQFYIFTYAGSEPLNLMVVPETIAANKKLLSQYNTFIESIDTIYASQTTNDNIPVFWTRRVSSVDSRGNTAIVYKPHPDSTLTQLNSKESYYVIVRNLDNIPLVVPILGTTTAGFTNNSLAPLISNLNNINLIKSSGNSTVIQPQISRLQEYETYSYEYKGLSANWPILYLLYLELLDHHQILLN